MSTAPTPGPEDIVRITASNVRNVETTNQNVRINGMQFGVPVNGLRIVALGDAESVSLPYMVGKVMMQAGIEIYVETDTDMPV